MREVALQSAVTFANVAGAVPLTGVMRLRCFNCFFITAARKRSYIGRIAFQKRLPRISDHFVRNKDHHQCSRLLIGRSSRE